MAEVRPFPLSRAQQALWFAQQLDPDVPFNIAQFVEVRGRLDYHLLVSATDRGCRELESAVVRLVDVAGEPHQVVDQSIEDALVYRDLRDHADPVAEAHRWMTDEYSRPLDLMADRLISATLLHLGHDHYYWFSRTHHLVMDAYGAMVLMNRVAELYTHLVSGTEAPQSKAMSMRALHDAENEYRTTDRYLRDREYWAERTAELPEPVRLTDRHARPTSPPRVSSRVMDAAVASRIEALARAWNSSEVPVIVAAFAAYLGRMTAATDVVLSLPVSARTTASARRSTGMMANIVPLRVHLDPGESVEELVRKVQLELTGALRRQRYRHEDMWEGRVQPSRHGFGPTVNIMNFHREIVLGELVGEFNVLTTGVADDLSLNLYPSVDGRTVRVDFEANPGRYEEEELERLLSRFVDFLSAFAAVEGDAPVGAVDVLTADEWAEATAGNPGVEPDAASLHELFLSQVAGRPDAVAVTFGDETLTYAELDERSAAVATSLSAAGVVAGDIVAVALAQSPDLIAATIGVVRAGAVYLPVDPQYPAERIQYLLDDARPVAVIADAAAPPVSTSYPRAVNKYSRARSAYVIYTSGSTGRPKGVLVTHANVLSLLANTRERVRVRSGRRVDDVPLTCLRLLRLGDVGRPHHRWPTGSRRPLPGPFTP